MQRCARPHPFGNPLCPVKHSRFGAPQSPQRSALIVGRPVSVPILPTSKPEYAPRRGKDLVPVRDRDQNDQCLTVFLLYIFTLSALPSPQVFPVQLGAWPCSNGNCRIPIVGLFGRPFVPASVKERARGARNREFASARVVVRGYSPSHQAYILPSASMASEAAEATKESSAKRKESSKGSGSATGAAAEESTATEQAQSQANGQMSSSSNGNSAHQHRKRKFTNEERKDHSVIEKKRREELNNRLLVSALVAAGRPSAWQNAEFLRTDA